MSEEDQGKLYGRFTRLSARPTAGESSTCLGLSIVKKLAEHMHGELDCRSTLGVGTTFRLTLPQAAANLVLPRCAPQPSAAQSQTVAMSA